MGWHWLTTEAMKMSVIFRGESKGDTHVGCHGFTPRNSRPYLRNHDGGSMNP